MISVTASLVLTTKQTLCIARIVSLHTKAITSKMVISIATELTAMFTATTKITSQPKLAATVTRQILKREVSN